MAATFQRRRSPSPALASLLEAAETIACDFATDAGDRLSPFVHAALQEEEVQPNRRPSPPHSTSCAAPRAPSPPIASTSNDGDLQSVMDSLGWDKTTTRFSTPLDPRMLSTRLKASLLTDLTLVGEGSFSFVYRAPEVLLGCRRYSEAVDMWSAGCVLAELALGAPLFAGDSEIGQLFQIFQLLGTPDEDAWPGVTNLPEWHPLFPKWVVPEGGLSSRIQGRLCPYALQLLEDLLQLDPLKRPTASQALAHPYFNPLRGG